MPNGAISTNTHYLRDLKTKESYEIPSALRYNSTGTLVTYKLAGTGVVDTVVPGVAGKIEGKNCVDDLTGQSIPLKTALRDVYPDGVSVRFYGTLDQVSALDPLIRVIGTEKRRIDLTDPSVAAPTDLSDLGVSVEQDGDDKSDDDKDQVYYYVGKESAWTTRVQTCTALAMWSRSAEISYLSHADAATSSQTIADNMTRFFEAAAETEADLSASGELGVYLFTATDTLTSSLSSLETTFLALNHIAAEYARLFFERAKCHIIGDKDAVVVSKTARPTVLCGGEAYLAYLMTRYAERGEQNISAILVPALEATVVNTSYDKVAYQAAMKAKEKGNRPLYSLLATLIDYTPQDALERWGW
ncbi:hypothetical protein [Sphaerisporangium aureirubrum]|uniref:Uncharacterized protein n=1 Tax=Sphaerisporangium aureirubrum TaxID=1544736 RepID=A0ABW1NRN7_9ACTN